MFSNLLTTLSTVVWDIDPVMIHLGPIELRYYGVLFATALFVGLMIIRWRYKEEKENPEASTNLAYAMMIAVVVGSRLGHCLLYEPDRYLANPIEILKFWHGGLASHGAAAGIILTCICYDFFFRKTPIRTTLDRLAYTIPVAMICVRLGNFFNSEIVGAPCDPNSPLAFIFPRYDMTPRYPSQLFEVCMGLVSGALVYGTWYYHKKRNKPIALGLSTGLIITSYMAMRFCVEFFKEYQDGEDAIGLTNGQIFSIPFFCVGLFMTCMALFGPWKNQNVLQYNKKHQLVAQNNSDENTESSDENTESSDKNTESSDENALDMNSDAESNDEKASDDKLDEAKNQT